METWKKLLKGFTSGEYASVLLFGLPWYAKEVSCNKQGQVTKSRPDITLANYRVTLLSPE